MPLERKTHSFNFLSRKHLPKEPLEVIWLVVPVLVSVLSPSLRVPPTQKSLRRPFPSAGMLTLSMSRRQCKVWLLPVTVFHKHYGPKRQQDLGIKYHLPSGGPSITHFSQLCNEILLRTSEDWHMIGSAWGEFTQTRGLNGFFKKLAMDSVLLPSEIM